MVCISRHPRKYFWHWLGNCCWEKPNTEKQESRFDHPRFPSIAGRGLLPSAAPRLEGRSCPAAPNNPQQAQRRRTELEEAAAGSKKRGRNGQAGPRGTGKGHGC